VTRAEDCGNASDEVVAQYVSRNKGWRRDQYRLAHRGPSVDGASDVVSVILLEDGHAAHPGGGESIDVYVDRASRRVIREVGGQ
jgi:hypothetical protein